MITYYETDGDGRVYVAHTAPGTIDAFAIEPEMDNSEDAFGDMERAEAEMEDGR